jgi:hypothetical protein
VFLAPYFKIEVCFLVRAVYLYILELLLVLTPATIFSGFAPGFNDLSCIGYALAMVSGDTGFLPIGVRDSCDFSKPLRLVQLV